MHAHLVDRVHAHLVDRAPGGQSACPPGGQSACPPGGQSACPECMLTWWTECMPTWWTECMPTWWTECMPTWWTECMPRVHAHLVDRGPGGQSACPYADVEKNRPMRTLLVPKSGFPAHWTINSYPTKHQAQAWAGPWINALPWQEV